MSNNLAIVIPAFKINFFRDALASIANQTCLSFTLYIGDDASPDNLSNIVDEFKGKINIVYKRFNENLGGKDLVAHWKRSIELINNEDWIWLFSDDDLMETNCVESFYKHLMLNQNVQLFHFNIKIINENNKIIYKGNRFPNNLSVSDFFFKRINKQINSTVVEYIFSRNLYFNDFGFKNYDLAWCSDDATWIKFARQCGIHTIPGADVMWRSSNHNISSNTKDRELVLRKFNSSLEHIIWTTQYFSENNIKDLTTELEKFKWTTSVIFLSPSFSFKEKYLHLIRAINILNFKKVKTFGILYLIYIHLKIKI